MQVTGNHHGTVLEQQIASLLQTKKYLKLMPDQIDLAEGVAWYVQQYRRFETLYGSKMRLDFYLSHPKKWPEGLAVECKWQQSAGSVEEKFPYTVANLRGIAVPSAILLAGGGYTDRARDWLLAQQTERLIIIEGLDRIVKWAHAQL